MEEQIIETKDKPQSLNRKIMLKFKEEQIIETKDKPQCLVVQRLLSHLQYLDATKSSTKDLSLPPSKFMNSWH